MRCNTHGFEGCECGKPQPLASQPLNDLLYDMKCHEVISIDTPTQVMRVPGGWLYRFGLENGTGGYDMTQTFVPFNSEFM